MNRWQKLDFCYRPQNGLQYASVPFVRKVKEDRIEVLFSNRDSFGRSFLQEVWLKITTEHVIEVEKENETPLLINGVLGRFDEDGVMACQSIVISGKELVYYIGWNLGKSVPFRNSIGLAEFDDGGKLIKKFNGPILDRSVYDPCFVASLNVIQIGHKYIMYYLSCIDWIKSNGRVEHKYHIKIAESNDGYEWIRKGKVAIDFKDEFEYAISVPRVKFESGVFKMWYSCRGALDSPNYKIGYAESKDGFNWKRKDDNIVFLGKSNFDSEMMCYPFVFDIDSNRYLIYNGNGYGKTGFGIAKRS